MLSRWHRIAALTSSGSAHGNVAAEHFPSDEALGTSQETSRHSVFL